MDAEELKGRTKEFAKRIIRLCRELVGSKEGQLLGNQLFRSGTSVGANYRAACRRRSRAEFAAKLGIVLEEVDETVYWLELIIETEVMKSERLLPLLTEANELTAIFAASLRTVKQSAQKSRTS